MNINDATPQTPDDNGPDADDVDPAHLAPLVFDASELHAHIESLTAALHRYVDLAVGARAEFDAATVEVDPRIEAAEDEIGLINAEISRIFDADLGLVSGHTTEAWDGREVPFLLDEDDDDEDTPGATVIDISLTVAPGPLHTGADPLERALEIVENAADDVTATLEDAGYTVDGWSVSRELADDDEDD
ncbi:hypothetical protein ACTVCO_06990 [Sanguibacter sp. A247]|uniref:hypothetical protein n=1 Tax=unclassified Sanguibacter TaxID=2645534 RepID=UPI003FD83F2B